jgi:glycosyltransferase involved in cell wall biosynthesis
MLSTQAADYERNTWIVVPALNEAQAIRRCVAELRDVFANVVVVDDGSEDATGDEALAAGAVVVRHPFNLGQGATIQTGIEYALARGAEVLATFDADGQHHVEDLQKMLHVLREEKPDVVLGSRFLGRAEGITRLRRLVLKTALVFTNLTTGVRLTDAHNGLRVMTATAARRLRIRQDRMAHASELIAQIGRLKLKVKEVPVTITYSEYSVGKGQAMSNSFRIVLDLFTGWLLR